MSLEEQSLSNASNGKALTNSFEYEQNGLSLVRASSESSTQQDDVFLPLYKASNVHEPFNKSYDATTSAAHRQASNTFHSLKEQKLSASTQGTLELQELNENTLSSTIENSTTNISSSYSMTSSPSPLTSLSQSPISATSLFNRSIMFEKLKAYSESSQDDVEKNLTSQGNVRSSSKKSSRSNTSSCGSTSEKYQQLLERVKQLPLLHAHEQNLLLESYEKSKATFFSLYSTNNENARNHVISNDAEHNHVAGCKNEQLINSAQTALSLENTDNHLNTQGNSNTMDSDKLGSGYFILNAIPEDSTQDFTAINTLPNHPNDGESEGGGTTYNTPPPIVFSQLHSDRQTGSYMLAQEHPVSSQGSLSASPRQRNSPVLSSQRNSVAQSFDSSRKMTVDERDKFFMSYFHDTTPELTSGVTRQSDDYASSDFYSIFTGTQDSFLPLPTQKSRSDKPLQSVEKCDSSYDHDLTQVPLVQRLNSFSGRSSSTTEANSEKETHDEVAFAALNNGDTGRNTHSFSSERTFSELMNLYSSGNSFRHQNELVGVSIYCFS